MNNRLRLLIRQTLFENHAKSLISEAHETSKTLSAKLPPESVAKVEARFNEINANINAATKYPFSPSSTRDKTEEGAISARQKNDEFKLLVEMIHERMPIEKQKNVFMIMFSQSNPYLQRASTYYITKDIGGTNQAIAIEAFRDAWERFFMGGTTQKRDETKEYKKFEQYASEYDKNKFDKEEDSNSVSTFAGRIVIAIQSGTRAAYSSLIGGPKISSLDAPSQVTGKSTDVDSGEDFGSDAMHADTSSDTLSDFGASFDDNDESTVDLDTDITTDDYEDTGAESGETFGDVMSGELSDYSDEELLAHNKAKKMAKTLVGSIYEAITDLKHQATNPVGKKNISPAQLQALDNLEKTLNTGNLTFDGFRSWGHSLDALKKSAFILSQFDKYIKFSGFRNSRGKAVSFADMQPKYLLNLIKFSQTKDPSLAPEEGLPSDYLGDTETQEKIKDIYGSETDIKDISKKVISIKKNIKDIVKSNPTEENLEGVKALDGIFKGMDLRQVSQALGKSAADVNKAVAGLGQGADAQEVVDLVRALKTGAYKKGYAVPYDAEAEESLREAVEIAESILMERFMKNNLEKIMERVYKRLSKNL